MIELKTHNLIDGEGKIIGLVLDDSHCNNGATSIEIIRNKRKVVTVLYKIYKVTWLDNGVFYVNGKKYGRKDPNTSANFYIIKYKRKAYKKILNFLKKTGLDYNFEDIKESLKNI